MTEPVYDEEYDLYCDDYSDEECCEVCGAPFGYTDDAYPGCPHCKSCGGIYAAGTEECDFCEYEAQCRSLYLRQRDA